MPGNQRRITQSQLDYLVGLIGADPEGGAYKYYRPYEKIWAPSGRHKYVITEEGPNSYRCITRLSNLTASGEGRLF